MPAAIIITQNEQQWIKEYLQETYDVVINDAFDCQTLSDAILKEKGIKISYSTFRRLFDLVKNTNSQSRFVLNALAVAVGFKSWDFFNQHNQSKYSNLLLSIAQYSKFNFRNGKKTSINNLVGRLSIANYCIISY